MYRKFFELIKDKLFDLCYEIIWMNKMVLIICIFYGLICFPMSYYRYKTVLSFANVPPRDELQQVNGRLLRFDPRKDISNGDDCIAIMLEDGSEYYVMNSLKYDIDWSFISYKIHPGDLIELRVHKFFGLGDEPKVVELSGENYYPISYERGKSFYNQDARNWKDEPKWMAVVGVILCMYGIIFLVIQHWLSQ